jgi:hypothetical protein
VFREEGDGALTVAALNAPHDFDVVTFPGMRPGRRRPWAVSDEYGEVGGGESKRRFALERPAKGSFGGTWISGLLCLAVPGGRLRGSGKGPAVVIGALHTIQDEPRL